MQIQPYLMFDGRCEEALEFYRKALGAKVEALIRFKGFSLSISAPDDEDAKRRFQEVSHA
jgi:PhnB protein